VDKKFLKKRKEEKRKNGKKRGREPLIQTTTLTRAGKGLDETAIFKQTFKEGQQERKHGDRKKKGARIKSRKKKLRGLPGARRIKFQEILRKGKNRSRIKEKGKENQGEKKRKTRGRNSH